MENAYILGGLRSYVGVVNGMYRHIPAEVLGAEVLKQVMEKYQLREPDYIIAGNGVGAGGNIARLMALTAGVDISVPAFTVDVQCGSGLESIAVAAAKINSGEADVIIAGGFESSSTQPRRGYNPNHPDYTGDAWYSVAKFMPGIHRETVMLEGAELAAKREGITKEEMDSWVLRSHALATQAREKGLLQNIIAPVCGAVKDVWFLVAFIEQQEFLRLLLTVPFPRLAELLQKQAVEFPVFPFQSLPGASGCFLWRVRRGLPSQRWFRRASCWT